MVDHGCREKYHAKFAANIALFIKTNKLKLAIMIKWRRDYGTYGTEKRDSKEGFKLYRG